MRKNLILGLCLGIIVVLSALESGSIAVFGSPPAVKVTIRPASATVVVGGGKWFSATVSGASSTAIVWMVNDVVGGNSTVGKIDAKGNYYAPLKPPPGYVVKVKAVSRVQASAFATSTVTIQYPAPELTSVKPDSVKLGAFTLTVTGSRFYDGAKVLWNGVAVKTTFVSTTQLNASGEATAVGPASVSVANPGPNAVSNSLNISVVAAVIVAISPGSAVVGVSSLVQFSATVSNASNQTVIWKVNNETGGNATNGFITSSGLYTAPAVVPPATTVTVTAVSAADNLASANATVTIQNPQAITYGRVVDQCSFGVTPALLGRAQQIGVQAFVDEQLNTPESTWPFGSPNVSQAIYYFFTNALSGQDQLRQRVVYALSEFFVISRNKNVNGNELVPWLQLLSRNAFGNYRTLLKEITLDATMGKYLDLANSGVWSGAPNENYPREAMQLLSIGLWQLNPDGSQKLDVGGQPIPTYTQADVQQLAHALTGWTYGNLSGIPPGSGNSNYFPGPMLPIESKHRKGAKTILGTTLPANQTAMQDVDGAVDIIFNHPNVAPFIVTRLIRALVTSNPSSGYISRAASVFDNNGSGVRGDLRAVIRAILLDPEARNDNPPPEFGRLRSALQHVTAMMRALNFTVSAANVSSQSLDFAYLFDSHFDEGLLNSPSVFGHYSPTFRIPKSPLFGPEFQIYSPSTAVNRANFLYSFWGNPWPINPILQPYVSVAGNPVALINAVDNALLFGRMSTNTRTAITNALPSMYDNNQRVFTALYLTVTSGEYLVQR